MIQQRLSRTGVCDVQVRGVAQRWPQRREIAIVGEGLDVQQMRKQRVDVNIWKWFQHNAACKCRAAGDEQSTHFRRRIVESVISEVRARAMRKRSGRADFPASIGQADHWWHTGVVSIVEAGRDRVFCPAGHVRLRFQQGCEHFVTVPCPGAQSCKGAQRHHVDSVHADHSVQLNDLLCRCCRHAVVGHDHQIDVVLNTTMFQTID